MNADDVSDLFFLDTNVLIYTFDASAPTKRALAREWVRAGLRSRRGVIGTQVVQEFLSVPTKTGTKITTRMGSARVGGVGVLARSSGAPRSQVSG